MKEYKLSPKSKYSVFYLLCGLFMFFFMFAIFNLCSYASSFQSSSVSIAPNESYSETYGLQTYSYNLDDYSIPVTTITTTSSGSGWTRGVSSTVARGSNTIHLVTSEGDFVVNVSQGTADGSNTNHTVTVLGVPQRVYSIFDVYNDTSSAKSVYAVTRIDSISVSDVGTRFGLGNHISDYSSFSLVNSLTAVQYYSSFNSDDLSLGECIIRDFQDISTTNLTPTPMWTGFSHLNNDKFLFVFYVEGPSHALDTYFSSLNFRVYTYNTLYHDYFMSDFNIVRADVLPGGGIGLSFACEFDLPSSSSVDTAAFYFTATSSVVCTRLSYGLFSYKATIADYMDYVKSNWDNISPSVTDTNQNIAQSVSDIGTAQTFETGAFTDFDTSMTTSGLDTFSLSFASAPLLWCASIINTFYNNMPSGFQYLLMFVAFVGILVIVLNIAGRVVRRFGGD